MNCSLNSVKDGYLGGYIGEHSRLGKGGYSSYKAHRRIQEFSGWFLVFRIVFLKFRGGL